VHAIQENGGRLMGMSNKATRIAFHGERKRYTSGQAMEEWSK
jgi:hypothetical protein